MRVVDHLGHEPTVADFGRVLDEARGVRPDLIVVGVGCLASLLFRSDKPFREMTY